MNISALILSLGMASLTLAACNPAPATNGEPDAKSAPTSTSASATGGNPASSPDPAMRWRYDTDRRAAIYGAADGTIAFWVACKGTPDGRSLYIEMPGKEAAAGDANLVIAGAGLRAIMPMKSAPATPDGGLIWSGEAALNANITKLFETVDVNVPLTVSIGGKDKRVIPNNMAIREAITACKS